MNKWIFDTKAFTLQAVLAILTTVIFPLTVVRPVITTIAVTEARRVNLETYYRSVIQPNTDLEAFARISAWAAAQPDADTAQYMNDLSWLIMGSPNSLTGSVVGPAGRILERLHSCYGLTAGYPALMRFGSAGFRADDKSNQVQHFWFSVILSYHFGPGFADAFARYHEWNAPGLLDLLPLTGHGRGDNGDLSLSRQAIQLGQALRAGSIRPIEVADWIRAHL